MKKSGKQTDRVNGIAHETGAAKSSGPCDASFSTLLALEPRFMFDAAVVAVAAEAAEAVASATQPADSSSHENESLAQQAADLAGFGITPLSGGYEQPNAAPTIQGGDSGFVGDEDTRINLSGIIIGDPEGDTLLVTITVENGTLFLVDKDGGCVIVTADTIGNDTDGYSKLVLEGSPSSLSETLASLCYQGAQDWYGADTLKIEAIEKQADQAAWHSVVTKDVSITVNSVNDLPVVEGIPGGSSSWSLPEDTPISFGDGAYKITLSDPDDGDSITVTFTATNGYFFSADPSQQVKSVTFSGTVEQVNEQIAGLHYQGDPDYYGLDTLKITAEDSSGQPQTWNVTMRITPVNDDPVLTPPLADVVVNEGDFTELDGSHFVLSDVDNTNNQLTIKLEEQPDPAKGVLRMLKGSTWVEVGVGSTFSYQDLLDGKIRYYHSGSQVRSELSSGSVSDSFKVSVTDGAGGSVKTGSDGNTLITLNVTIKPVNQAPEVSVSAQDGTHTVAVSEDPRTGETVYEHLAYEGENGAVIKFTIKDPDQALDAAHSVKVTKVPVDGALYYDDGTGSVRVTVGMVLSMDVIAAGGLTYNHDGDDGAFLTGHGYFDNPSDPVPTIPLGGTRPDGFQVEVIDDGGGEGPGGELSILHDFTINIHPNNDLPYFPGGLTSQHGYDDVAGVIPVDNWGITGAGKPMIILDNTILNVKDNDNDSQSIVYVVNKDISTSVGGLYYYSEREDAYRRLGEGDIFTQLQVDQGKIVFRYGGAFSTTDYNGTGNTGHQGLDAIQLLVRDGCKTVVDENGDMHLPDGFEGGYGEWTNGEWALKPVNLVVNVDFEHVPGGPGPETQDLGDKYIDFSGDKTSTVFEGGEVTLTEEDLDASVYYGYSSKPSEYEREPHLTYRIENEFKYGTLYIREYDVVTGVGPGGESVETVVFTGNVTELVNHSGFTWADVCAGAIYYQHDGTENFTDSMSFSITNGAVEYFDQHNDQIRTVDFTMQVKPVNDTPYVMGDPNNPLEVKEGGPASGGFAEMGVVLTPDKVILFDTDGSKGDVDGKYSKPNDLSFVIVGKPANGAIWVYGEYGDKNDIANWTEVVYATQANAEADPDWAGTGVNGSGATILTYDDLAGGNVRYIHDGSENFSDSINIMVNDGKNIPLGGMTESGTSGNVQVDENGDPLPANSITGEHGSSISGLGTIDVVIQPVNDAPAEQHNDTLTVPCGDPEKQFPNDPAKRPPNLNDLVLGQSGNGWLEYTDSDNTADQLQYRITAAPEHGKVYLYVGSEWRALGIDSNFSQDDIDNGLVIYIHDGSENHTDSFSFILSDGDETRTSAGAYNILIEKANAKPEIIVSDTLGKGADGNYYVTDGTGKDLSGVFQVDDPDYRAYPDGSGINTDRMEVTLTAIDKSTGLSYGKLDFKSGYIPGGTLVYSGDGSGTFVLTGSKEDLNEALDNLIFIPDAGPDLNGSVIVTMTLDDLANGDEHGIAGNAKQADPVSIELKVSTHNDVPVAESNDRPDSDGSFVLTLQEDDDWTAVLHGSGKPICIADVDSFGRNVNVLTLEVTNGLIAFTNTSGLTFLEGCKNKSSRIVVQGTLEAINAALATLQYKPGEDFSGNDTITVKYADGKGSDWSTGPGGIMEYDATVAITVAPVNDAPTLDVPNEPIVIDKTNSHTVTINGKYIEVDDPRDLDGQGYGVDVLEVKITANRDSDGMLYGSLTATQQGSVLISGSGTSEIIIKGTRDDVNNTLKTLAYKAESGCPDDTSITLTVVVDDLDNGSNPQNPVAGLTVTDTVTILINDVNDIPEIQYSGSAVLDEDTTFTFTGPDLISINDPDAMGYRITVTITVEHGTLELGSTSQFNHLDSWTGKGGTETKFTSITITASQEKINQALDGLVYRPNADWNGTDTLIVTSDDHGFSSADPSNTNKTDTKPIAITVKEIADAPTTSSGNVAMDAIDEDIANASNGGKSVNDLFGGLFGDVKDAQYNNSTNIYGSESNAFIGVWVTGIESNVNHGGWQYYDNNTSSWTSIADGMFLSKTTLVRFNPATDFNSETNSAASGSRGTVEPLKVRLVESKDYASAHVSSDLATGAVYSVSDLNHDASMGGGARYNNADIALSIVVRAVNDKPAIQYSGTTGDSSSNRLAVNEDSVLSIPAITVSDVDVNERLDTTMQVTLTVGKGSLTLGTTTGLTGYSGSGATLTLTGSLTAINNALASLTYQGNADYNGEDALVITVSDKGNTGTGGVLTDEKTIYLKVNEIADSPTSSGTTVTMPEIAEDVSSSSNSGSAVSDLFGGLFGDVKDAQSGVANPSGSESNAFIGVWVTGIESNVNHGAWQYYDNNTSSWTSIADGMFLSKTTLVRFNPATNFNSETNAAASGNRGTVEPLKVRLVESKDYASAHVSSDLATGTVYAVSDLNHDASMGGGARYNNADIALSIVVRAVNDKPAIQYSGTTGDSSSNRLTVNEDSVLSIPAITVSDVDVNEHPDTTMQVTLTVGKGSLTLGTTTGLTGYSGSGATLTLTGSLTAINNALASLTYQGNADYNGEDALVITVSDKGNTGTGGEQTETKTIYLQVDPVNDAPVITAPGSVSLLEDGTYAFPGANKISVADSDIAMNGNGDGVDYIKVTLSVDHGTLTLGVVTGLTNHGSGLSGSQQSFVFSGSLAQVNAALASLNKKTTPDRNRNPLFINIAADDGSAGTNGLLSDSTVISMNVTAVNDAPVADNNTSVSLPDISEDQQTSNGETVADLFQGRFNDSKDAVTNGSNANSMAGIVIVDNGANALTQGKWQYFDGTVWTDMATGLSDSRALFLDAATRVRFVPVADFNGDAPALKVRLVDSSSVDSANNPLNGDLPANGAITNLTGKTGGTTRYSADTITLVHRVVAVNDSPLVDGAVGGVARVDIGDIDNTHDITSTGRTVQELFGDKFNDNKDQQYNSATNPSGSTKNSFTGVLITETNLTTFGQWYYSTDGGTSWNYVTLSPGQGLLLASDAVLRFEHTNVAKGPGDYNLTARLIDDSNGPVTSGSLISIPSTTDVTDAYSESVVKIDLYVLGVNTPPTINGLVDITVHERDSAPQPLVPSGSLFDTELSRDTGTTWQNVTLTISRDGAANADDVFASSNTAVLSQLTQGSALSYGNVVVGTVLQNSDGTLKIVFNQNATQTEVDGVLKAIGYQNTSHAPEASLVLKYVVNDGNEAVNGRQGSGGALDGTVRQTVYITAEDEDPIAGDDTNTIVLRSDKIGSATGNVLLNDYDPDGTLVEVLSSGTDIYCSYGTLTLNTDGSYTYVVDPANATVAAMNPGDVLVDSFTYFIKDGNSGTPQSATLTIEIRLTQDNVVADEPSVVGPNIPGSEWGGGLGDVTTPVQDEVGQGKDFVDGHVSGTVDGLHDLVASHRENNASDMVYDLGRFAWSDEITLTGYPDARNVYISYTQRFTLPAIMFVHSIPGEELYYEAVMGDGSPLPDWIVFDPSTMTFACTPPEGSAGTADVVILAKDSKNNFAKVNLTLNVRDGSERERINGFRDPDQINAVDEGDMDETELGVDGDVLPGDLDSPGVQYDDEDTVNPMTYAESAVLDGLLFVDAADGMVLPIVAQSSGLTDKAGSAALWRDTLVLAESASFK